MKLIFATNNANKIAEVRSAMSNDFELLTLADAGIHTDIPEPYDTLEENASEKSSVIHRLSGQNCFSEDTGLEVTAINGAPGVRSARYAGDDADSARNIDLLLKNMHEVIDRRAQFKTVISLIISGIEYQFCGICKGTIQLSQKGEGGFGYDSIFIPDGSEKTFAEMTMEEKNRFSHRKKALVQLIAFLNTYDGKDQDQHAGNAHL